MENGGSGFDGPLRPGAVVFGSRGVRLRSGFTGRPSRTSRLAGSQHYCT